MSEKPKTHRLKTWPAYYQAILDGRKTFELRENDRGFMVDDLLKLEEWDEAAKEYTGRYTTVRITYMMDDGKFGLPDHMCIMSIENDEEQPHG